MNDLLLLFSSELERNAAFPEGIPDGLITGITGVGLIDSAIGTTRLIAEHQPATVVFAGTCGAHRGSGAGIGDVIVASEIRLGSGDVAQGWMRIPSLLPSVLKCDEELSQRIVVQAGSASVKRGNVSCTLGITETDELAAALFDYDGSHTENLEAFSVMRAAGSVPAAIVLGVTNIVGAGGGRDWKENYQRMMVRVGGIVTEFQRSYNDVSMTT